MHRKESNKPALAWTTFAFMVATLVIIASQAQAFFV